MELTLNLPLNSYDIVVEKGALNRINKFLSLKGKILLVFDDLIPNQYIEMFLKHFPNAIKHVFIHGESHKNYEEYLRILSSLAENEFSRSDNIVSLGGGVCSDLAGFAASTYMRGINFYIISSTFLADVDASIGGKVAINFNHYKNLVGSFYQPKKVIIDPDLLKTLNNRLFFEGLVESIKMAATYDKNLFDFIDSLDTKDKIEENIEEIIYRSLLIKKDIVEKDEKENGLRKILNFGHTVGHAIEGLSNGELYHGECVGIGMTYFSSTEVEKRIINILKRFSLPYIDHYSTKEIMSFLKHDKKKKTDDLITICYVEKIGEYQLIDLSIAEIENRIARKKHEK